MRASSDRLRRRHPGPAWALFLGLSLTTAAAAVGDDEDCLGCHQDPDLVGSRHGAEISVFVDPAVFSASVHGELGLACVDCHADLADVELPHQDDLAPVDCALCHDDAAGEVAAGRHRRGASCAACHGTHDVLSPTALDSPTNVWKSHRLCERCHATQGRLHRESLHGRARAAGDELAPTCVSCHQHHRIRSHREPDAPTSTLNIPLLCGTCHHEGTAVSIQHDIPQDRILENYSSSIHGVGLFQKGLTVTAVCTSCHTAHHLLEHTDPRSSIHPDRVAETCTVCHARIEEVHVKVIEGRLWEEEPHRIPSCTDCHSPHKIRRPSLAPGAANRDCLRCHSDPTLTRTRDDLTVSLFVDAAAYDLGKHAKTACAQCHTDVSLGLERPCATVQRPVDCGICHADRVAEHHQSVHGRLAEEGDPDAPTCLDCHQKHYTEDHRVPSAPTYPRNVPELCGRCHRTGEVAARRISSRITGIVASYEMSIHGKGLVESGLVVSATCTDCHTAHRALPASDPASTVHHDNIASTCGTCHHGIDETFRTSIHWPANVKTERELPTCEDCHTSHTIGRIDAEGFRLTMMRQCGSCHTDEAETFFDTYHGKVSRLGSEGAAKCYDCHGTHDILPVEDPASHLSRANVVETCAQCHAGAHRRFAGYLTHATHHDPDKYPFLFYSFWFMTLLLVGTLSFAILHTLAWLFRLWRTREHWAAHKHQKAAKYYRRFSRAQRLMHLIMLLSFFTLALTGMALKFSYMGWAQTLSNGLGGFASMGLLHRIGALILMGLFAFHLRRLRRMKRKANQSWWQFVWDPGSMMFNLTDVRQVLESVKWFLGRGPRPHYGRFTYWEKFDYFAVFWGVAVIGGTGLVLWFPELFTRLLPGWSINIATIIHSDEALLAVGFIFTVHFFNTHFRPDKFPMDPVIFTGRVSLEELAHDKPAEYQALTAGRTPEEIEALLVDPFPEQGEKAFRIFGFTALGIGLTLIFLIVYAMLVGYR